MIQHAHSQCLPYQANVTLACLIMVVHPKKYEGLWVFDNPVLGPAREPCTSGANSIIGWVIQNTSDAHNRYPSSTNV